MHRVSSNTLHLLNVPELTVAARENANIRRLATTFGEEYSIMEYELKKRLSRCARSALFFLCSLWLRRGLCDAGANDSGGEFFEERVTCIISMKARSSMCKHLS
jgi:hypothetical protein